MRTESGRWCTMAYRDDTGQQGEYRALRQVRGARLWDDMLTRWMIAATLPVPIQTWVMVNEN